MEEISEELTILADREVNIHKVCRACLAPEGDLREIRERNEEYHDFLEMYKSCTSVDPHEIIDLPFIMCERCLLQIRNMHTFRKMCVESHITLRSIISKSNEVESRFNEKNEDLKEFVISKEESCIDNSNRNPDYRCNICLKAFGDVISLTNHNEDVHTTKDYKCALCEETYNVPSLLSEHVKIHDKTDNPSKRKFACGRCGKSYTSINNLQVHMYSHVGLKPYLCEYCPMAFTKRHLFKNHVKIHTGLRDHICDECGKMYMSSTVLNRHKTTHSECRPHQCDFCPKTFWSTADLKVHRRSHTGEKPYLCSTCGKSFKRTTHLKVHRRTHTGEKPYVCFSCGRSFAQSGDLKAHERIHTGEKPHCCKICGRRFNQSSGLSTHMKKHSNAFKCGVCDKMFENQKCLSVHSKTHVKSQVE